MTKTNNTKVKDGRIKYKFKCGIEAYQEELDLRQDELLTEILLELNIETFSFGNTKIKELVNILIKERVLIKVLDIILTTVKDTECDFLKLKNSELEEVFEDFFSLNPTVTNWLRNIGKGLTSSPLIQSISSSSNPLEKNQKGSQSQE